jgi:hypothetical protein
MKIHLGYVPLMKMSWRSVDQSMAELPVADHKKPEILQKCGNPGGKSKP